MVTRNTISETGLFPRLVLALLVTAVALTLPSSVQSAPSQSPSASNPPQAGTVGKWRRYTVSLANPTYAGNPFELEVEGTFTHSSSGAVLTLPGYYAGSDIWKIGFMPTEVGDWTYVTSSIDADLDGLTGSLTAIDSGHPGMLKADTANPRKWKYTDGPYVVPIQLRLDLFNESSSAQEFDSAADFLQNEVKGQLFEGTLQNGVFTDWASHQFDLALWDRLEERMDVLTERGLGYHVMLYTDDAGTPPWGGRSATEQLLIRYTVARLAGFPSVWFNVGIDSAEYRTQADIDWIGRQYRSLDPYDHPVSSRYDGGGADKFLMNGRTWVSRGDIRAYIDDMTGYLEDSSIPVSMDDAWGENRPSHRTKNFRPEDIRRAFWKAVVAGGLGGIIRGSDYWYSITGANSNTGLRVDEDLESEQWLIFVNPFVQTKLGNTFGVMVPEPALVSNGYAIADPARSKILYFLMGQNDKWDLGNGGDLTVRLSTVSGSFTATWFDTRTGAETSAGVLAGGTDHVLTPPSTDDWVLLLNGAPPDATPPSQPSGLSATLVTESEVQLTWSAASDPESGVSRYNVYRNATLAGSPAGTTFGDTGRTEGTSYSYEVAAVNGAGLEGPRSQPLTVTTPADVVPPTITSLTADGGTLTITIFFSEPVEQTSATNVANYALDNGAAVTSASLGADTRILTLATSGLVAGGSYTLTVTGVTDRAATPNPIAPGTQRVFIVPEVTPDLAGHWRFDEASGLTALDSAGANDGTLSNMDPATDRVQGRFGRALDFDGSDDVVTVPSDPSLEGFSAITLSAWTYLTAPAQQFGSRIVSKAAGSTGDDYSLQFMNGGELRVRVTNSSKSDLETSGANIPLNQWSHVAGTSDGLTIRAYINGLEVASRPSSSGAIRDSNGLLSFGAHSGSAGDRRFQGLIDEVRIYNRALSDTEVLALFGVTNYPTLPGMASPVQDLDKDGRAEDLNGNGRLDFADVVALFEHMDSPMIQDEPSLFDFNGNGLVDVADVVVLFDALMA